MSPTYTQYVRRSARGPYTPDHENSPCDRLLAGVAALAGCGGSSTPSSSSKPFVVLVTDINQLNDHGFNQLAYQGLKRAEREPRHPR